MVGIELPGLFVGRLAVGAPVGAGMSQLSSPRQSLLRIHLSWGPAAANKTDDRIAKSTSVPPRPG